MKSIGTLTLIAFLFGCGSSDDSNPPLFPADYATTYQEVRNCRNSIEHDLVRVRILAAPDALTAYNGRLEEFPVGAVALKEEYDGGDINCERDIMRWTVMRKLAPGSSPDTLDWEWQEVDEDRREVDVDIMRCTNCHTDCGKPPEGYAGTCAAP